MKKFRFHNHLMILTLICFGFNSCEFNQSVEKDLLTGAYTRGDGLSCDDVQIIINGILEKRNTFTYGENVLIVFNDIHGFSKTENFVFPGLAMYIVQNSLDTLLSESDLLANLTQGTDLSPLQLQATFQAALPYSNQEKYKIHIRIWDKKGKGSYTYELPFSVMQNNLIQITSSNVVCSNVYLMNETTGQTVTTPEVSSSENLAVILEGPTGFSEKDGLVFPILALTLKDNTGDTILSYDNMLSEFENTGINAEDIANGQLSANISFGDEKINNPLHLEVLLKDAKSKNHLIANGTLEIK